MELWILGDSRLSIKLKNFLYCTTSQHELTHLNDEELDLKDTVFDIKTMLFQNMRFGSSGFEIVRDATKQVPRVDRD